VHRERRGDIELRQVFDLMAEEVGAAAFVRQQSAILGRADSRASLGNIRCPAQVLVGEGDELTPPERAAEIAAGIPGARLTTIPHWGPMPRPEGPVEVPGALWDGLGAWPSRRMSAAGAREYLWPHPEPPGEPVGSIAAKAHPPAGTSLCCHYTLRGDTARL